MNVCVGGGNVEGLRWLQIECGDEGVDLVPIERSLGEVLVVVVVWGGVSESLWSITNMYVQQIVLICRFIF